MGDVVSWVDVPEWGTGIDKGTRAGAQSVQALGWQVVPIWVGLGGRRREQESLRGDVAVMNKSQPSGCGEVSPGDWGSPGQAHVSHTDFLQHDF